LVGVGDVHAKGNVQVNVKVGVYNKYDLMRTFFLVGKPIYRIVMGI